MSDDKKDLNALWDLVCSTKTDGHDQYDLVAHLHRQREFSLRTFGPGERTEGVLDHIQKEIFEVRENPKDISEWIDIVILALDGALRMGFEPEQIAEALEAKQAKNESRKWPDWRTAEPGKAIQHVKEAIDDVTHEDIGSVLASIAGRFQAEILALTEDGLKARWWFKWNPGMSDAWNLYEFTDALEGYRRTCRTWEEHHGGSCCVVERVRDKYLMPRVREFFAMLHGAQKERAPAVAPIDAGRLDEEFMKRLENGEHLSSDFLNN
ncbi:dATP/dGTP pyrophosphohydrolase domain-containing protein [Ferrovum sp.]|uniref:dATP/dGTP pyrophosphohydrolase domain-containing protein n=1 Tax=Ferrovum sp. TaxID=2609467 RepID=UPI00261E99F8|nr:dATP/dGTP pyrophosphohydrolase domain-containing protein [Ferrovum sp.]